MTYLEISKYFGTKLSDTNFQTFLKSISCDPAQYNVSTGDYISSETIGLDMGFKNVDAVYDDDDEKVFEKGTPIFSLFNMYPMSEKIVSSIPFDIKFSDNRNTVREKAGQPVKITDAIDKLLDKHFLIDHFKMDNIAISIDYNSKDETIEFIQIRDNNLVDENLKL